MATAPPPVQVLVCGASALIRAGITRLLEAHPERVVVVDPAGPVLPRGVDLVLLDLDDGPVPGESAMGMLTTFVRSGLPVVALSWRTDEPWAQGVRAAGPAGVVHKGTAGDQLVIDLVRFHARSAALGPPPDESA